MTLRQFLASLAAAVSIIGAAAFFLVVTPVKAGECGAASWYGIAHQGKLMANGRPFNRHAMTAASWGYPLGTKVRVTAGAKSVVVTITDRGPAKRLHRVIDLSEAAFAKLANIDRGVIQVCVARELSASARRGEGEGGGSPQPPPPASGPFGYHKQL